MRFFKFDLGQKIQNFAYEQNEWRCYFKHYSIFGLASLKSPIVKEVSYLRGTTVQFVRYSMHCIGLIINKSFYGVPFFDLRMRPLWVSLIFFGMLPTTQSIVSAVFWGGIVYLLESVASIRDDNELMLTMQQKLQM